MLKQLEGARLGIFMFFGTVLLVISIFLLGSKESLFSSTIELKSYFGQIEGLKSGAPVRLSGYDVGSISSISMASDTSARVEVIMRIDKSLKHFIRLDSEASIETEGLVGKKIISISPGSSGAEEIQNGTIIKSKAPVNVSKIIEQTEAVMGYMKNLTKDFSEIFAKVNSGEGSIGKLVNDDKLYNSAVAITQSADKSLTTITNRLGEISDLIIKTTDGVKSTVTKADNVFGDISSLVGSVKNGEGTLGKLLVDKKTSDSVSLIIANLTRISDETRKATTSLAENMEALKHNWLFKNYFEQRGYWDKSLIEKEIDERLNGLKYQQELLDKKMEELRELENKVQKK